METIRCIFCQNAGEDRAVIEENGFTGRKCSRCGLVYISPRPSRSEMMELYTHDQSHISAERHLKDSFIKRIYARHHLAIIRRYIKDGSLLEIGAGAGYFLDEARKKGFGVFGLEPNPIQAEFMNRYLRIPCDSRTLSEAYENQTFDIIYHCDVISHFYDPFQEFSLMNSRLKPHGYVIFETGNGDFHRKYYADFSSFQYPDHLFFFNERNIQMLLRRTGFELLAMYRYSLLPQLKISKFMRPWLRKKEEWAGGEKGPKEIQGVDSDLSYVLKRSQGLKNIIRNGASLFFYVLRYKIGSFFPKIQRPYTFIVIARKFQEVSARTKPSPDDQQNEKCVLPG